MTAPVQSSQHLTLAARAAAGERAKRLWPGVIGEWIATELERDASFAWAPERSVRERITAIMGWPESREAA